MIIKHSQGRIDSIYADNEWKKLDEEEKEDEEKEDEEEKDDKEKM